MFQPYAKFVAVCALGILMVACAGTQSEQEGEEIEATVVDNSSSASDTDSSSTVGISDAATYTGDMLDDPSSLLSTRVVYFEFDRADVRLEDRAVIEAHAQYLAENPGAQVALEGHADERGTREYNAALGEHRAKAVRSLMSFQGASAQQMRTVSWGEERPIDRGHDETAWSANRRVEIIYLSRN